MYNLISIFNQQLKDKNMTTETKEDNRPKNIWQSIERMTELLAEQGIAKKKSQSKEITYAFRGIDDIRNVIAPMQKECALLIMPSISQRTENSERKTKNGGFSMWVVLHVHFKLTNTIDGSSYVVKYTGEAVDYSDKATQKAMSQAYKIFAINTFNIPTEGEQDTDNEKIELKSSGHFTNPLEREIFVDNCKQAIAATINERDLKDTMEFYRDKLVLMANSDDQEDRNSRGTVSESYLTHLANLRDKNKGTKL